jgi:4-hydroxy-tetrahydrodipicolinate reductase
MPPTVPLRVCVAGATGRVGQALVQAIGASADLVLVGAVARRSRGQRLGTVLHDARLDLTVSGTVAEALAVPTDVLVDYTQADAVKDHVLTALGKGVHTVIGTSGLTADDYREIHDAALAAGIGVFAAGNFAITAALLQRLAAIVARHVPHWEIIDYSRADKIDAPSGTARELAHRLAQGGQPAAGLPVEATVGVKEARGGTVEGSRVHSVRLPGYASAAEIVFGLPGERLTLRHDALDSAAPYVAGTLLAVCRVSAMRGLVRGLDQLLDLSA